MAEFPEGEPTDDCRPLLAPEILYSPEGKLCYLQGRITVSSDSVCIYGPEGILDSLIDSSEDFNIPGFEYHDDKVPTPQKIFCEISEESPGIKWYPEHREAIIKCDQDTLQHTAAIPFLAQNITEFARQEKSHFTVQANTVITPKNEAIVVLGERGSGKTNLTLELCQNFDCRFYANGQVILGMLNNEPYVLNGAKQVLVRKNQLPELIAEYVAYSETAVSAFDEKVIARYEDFGIDHVDGQFKIGKIAVVHLDALGKAETIVRKKHQNSIMDNLFLAEKLQRQISGISTPLLDVSGNLIALSPSYATELTKTNCVRFIHSLYNMVEIYEVSGSDIKHLSNAILATANGREQ